MAQGYLEASFDSVIFTPTDSALIINSIGPCYTLSLGEIGSDATRQTPFSPRLIEKQLAQAADRYPPHLRPFLGFKFDSAQLAPHHLTLRIGDSLVPALPLSSLTIAPAELINPRLLPLLLGVKGKDSITPHQLNLLLKRAERIPQIELSKPPDYWPTPRGLRIHLQGEKRPTNSISARLSLLPSDNAQGKPQLSGYANIQLANLIKRAESLSFQWFSPRKGSHELYLTLQYPYILTSPWGISLSLRTQIDPTLGQAVTTQGAVLYTLSPESALSLGIHYTKVRTPPLPEKDGPSSQTLYLASAEGSYSTACRQFPIPLGITARASIRAGSARALSSPPLPRLDAEADIAYAVPLARPRFLFALDAALKLRTVLRQPDALPMVERITPALFTPYLGFLPHQFYTRFLGSAGASFYWHAANPLALFTQIQYSLLEVELKPSHLLGYGLGLTLSSHPAQLNITLARGEQFTQRQHYGNPWLLHISLAFLF